MDLGTKLNEAGTAGRRVLLVDDEPHVQFAIKFLIREWKFEVLTASSGSEALELFQKAGEVDLIVTDYSMPDMNGWEFARRVRQLRPHQKILMLTALPEMLQGKTRGEGANQPAEPMPVNCILPKPPTPISMLRTVMEDLICQPMTNAGSLATA